MRLSLRFLRFLSWSIVFVLWTGLTSESVARRRGRRRHRRHRVVKTPQQRAAAQSFKRGNKLFKARDYLGALEAFEEAYKFRPHYLMQCNIARCHERLVDMISAAKHYRRCLAEGAARRRRMARKVRKALALVEARTSHVSVDAPGGGDIYVDGKRRGKVPRRVAINPGRRTIEVRREGARPASTTLELRGGERRSIVLRPVLLAREREHDRDDDRSWRDRRRRAHPRGRRGVGKVWFWVVAAVTAGLTATATVLGVRALGAKSDYEDHPTREGYTVAQDRRLLANIFWGAALAAGAGTTTLFFFTNFKSKREHRRREDDDVSVGIGLSGRF